MKNVLKLAVIFLMVSFLSGCLTSILWKSDKSQYYSSIMDKDSLIALGENTKTEQIVVMGEKYWFALDEKSSKEIRAITSANFSAPFKTDSTIKMDVKENNRFDTLFTLYYSPTNESEKDKIKKLGFECLSQRCRQLYFIYGDIYKAEKLDLKSKGMLKEQLPIELFTENKIMNGIDKGASVIGKIFQTPFALAGDLIILPFALFGMSAEALSNK